MNKDKKKYKFRKTLVDNSESDVIIEAYNTANAMKIAQEEINETDVKELKMIGTIK